MDFSTNPTVDTPSELSSALAALGLRRLPFSRSELARLVAARHPASRPWNRAQTTAYRLLWESLEPDDRQEEPRLAA